MNKYAYFSGVNIYSNGNNLRGCVNDCMDMRERIVAKYSVQPDNIRVLTDTRATTKVGLEHLDWLIGCCSPTEQDVLIFQNSSHGTRFRIRDAYGNLNNWESDVICPSDFNWDTNFISAEMIHAKFDKIPPNTTLIFISDSCCSGDLVRELSWSSGVDSAKSLPKRMIPPDDIRARSISRDLGVKKLTDYVSVIDSVNIVFLSGCQSSETSADAYMNGRYNGALTNGLKALIDAAPNATWECAHKYIIDFMEQNSFAQHPEVKGSTHLLTSKIFEN